MDEKKLRGEEEHTISKGEIAAWHRGKGDADKNKILSELQSDMPVEKAIKVIKLYGEVGDVHFIATKLDVRPEHINALFNKFGIKSIEDARSVAKDGIIAEFETALEEQRDTERAEAIQSHQEAQDRMDAEEEARSTIEVDSPPQSLTERQDEARIKNKKDRLRQLISEGIDPKTGETGMSVPLSRVREFKSLIPHGVSQLQRRFGGTRRDIINEIKRLVPHVDISLLRP